MLDDIRDSLVTPILDCLKNPEFLNKAGNIFTAMTGVSAAVGMHYADKILLESDKKDWKTWGEAASCFIPAAGFLYLSNKSHNMSGDIYKANIGELTAGYLLISKSYEDYKASMRKASEEMFGKNKADKLEAAAAQNRTDMRPLTGPVQQSGIGKSLFWDETTRQYLLSSYEEVKTNLASLADLMNDEGEISVDQYCDIMGLKRIPYGDGQVWNKITMGLNPFLLKNVNWSSTFAEDYEGHEKIPCGNIYISKPMPKELTHPLY